MFIRLNSIEIFAYHGAYEEETKSGNHFEIDIKVEVRDTLGTTTDRLSDAVDYTEILKIVTAVSDSKRFTLLEAFTYAIGKKVLEEFPDIKNIAVKVRKLNPPMEGSVKNVEVELRMEQRA